MPQRRPPARVRVRGVPGRAPSPHRDDGVKGTPLNPEQAQARIDIYRGSKSTSRAVKEFVKQVVRDALHVAPQPPTTAWISYSTTVIGLIAAVSEAQGMALTAEAVLDRARIDRFVAHECKHLSEHGRSAYRSRLDVIAGALLHGQNETAWPRAVYGNNDTTEPWTQAEAAAVILWVNGLRPRTRQERMTTLLALTLGAGLRRRDIVTITGDDVTVDDHGVHVFVPASPSEPERTVTVSAAFEPEVTAAATRAGSNLLVAPDKPTLVADTLTQTIDTANASAPGTSFSIRRARNTWLCRHLLGGTPLPILMRHAGLTTTAHLQDLLPFLPTVDATVGQAWMRKGRP